jgi:transketolase
MNAAAGTAERDTEQIEALQRKAKQIRRNVLRMAQGKGEGYVGQGLGASDILAAAYFHAMEYDPERPDWPERDRFLLSTGHYAIVLYAALTTLGIFPEEKLSSYGADESDFGMTAEGHVPGIEMTGGSLGQGLSIAIGMALSAGLGEGRRFNVFNFLSDGELQEGATWEAAMAAAHYELDNLVAFVDYNYTQADGLIEDIMPVEPVAKKWEAFGWHAQNVDGNSMEELVEALDAAAAAEGKPSAIVCYTQMGSGVPFITERQKGHFVRVEPDEWEQALADLEKS